MIYLPLVVFVGVTVWIAGWHKALEITAGSLFICFIFGIGFGVTLPLSVLPRILIGAALLLAYFLWRRRQHSI
ncbi:MAG: hypothetical protein WCB94_07155 [Terriglobales bacterium]